MIHHTVDASENSHYAADVNNERTHVLLQLGKDQETVHDAPRHNQIRLKLTAQQTDNLIRLLTLSKAKILDSTGYDGLT